MSLHSKFVAGVLKFFSSAHTSIMEIDPVAGSVNIPVSLKINGTDVTAPLAAAVAGVAAGYKMARGSVTPTSASHTVVTGLSTVVAAIAVLHGAPSLTHLFTQASIGNQSGAPAAGSILIVSQKPTANNDVTPIASTTPWGQVDWIAIGT